VNRYYVLEHPQLISNCSLWDAPVSRQWLIDADGFRKASPSGVLERGAIIGRFCERQMIHMYLFPNRRQIVLADERGPNEHLVVLYKTRLGGFHLTGRTDSPEELVLVVKKTWLNQDAAALNAIRGMC